MSSAAKIDFENYFALFATSLERFSIPSLGSFVWHIERAEVDPKTAQIKPPRPQLKYEPGQRYLTETVAFLIDRYGLSLGEAEAFLKELGHILLNYLKAANEMDVWKLGKLRRAGVSYRLELSEEAPLSFLEDLQPVSLRHSEGAVAPLTVSSQPTAPAAPKKAEKAKPPKESTRAKVVEVSPQPAESTPRKRRGLAWIGVVFLVLVGVGLGAYFILRKRERASHQPVEVVLGSKQGKSSETSRGSEKTLPADNNVSAPQPEKKAKSETTSPPSSTPKSSSEKPAQAPPAPEKAPAPKAPSSPVPSSSKPALTTPQKGRYYVIVGSYPSLEEAYENAKALGSSTVEFLPVPERGRVRVSYYSSSSKAEAEARLREVRTRFKDAWLYTP
jgi:cell division septation protein DedD